MADAGAKGKSTSTAPNHRPRKIVEVIRCCLIGRGGVGRGSNMVVCHDAAGRLLFGLIWWLLVKNNVVSKIWHVA
jgi:hypothetical protein